MSTLYLLHQGTTLHKEHGRFLIQQADSNITKLSPAESEIPIREVERILVFGHVQVTAIAISTCLDTQIPIVFLSQSGTYKGHLWPAVFCDLKVEKAQFMLQDNPAFQLTVARAIVRGKLLNSKRMLLKLNRKRCLPAVADAIAGLSSDIAAVEVAGNLETLRGYEGIGATRYFSAFGQLITNPNFNFTERNRRPPKDPVNSLLSFGYTILFNNVLSLILAEGLNPYLGNLHGSERKELFLGFDLVEEFRSLVVDSTVLKLVNKNIFKPSDFTKPELTGGVYLADPVRRVFIKKIEERLSELVSHPDVQEQVQIRRAIQLQVRRYKQCLLKSIPYEAFVRAA